MKTWQSGKGYLYCWFAGERRRHHAVVWEQANGPVPSGYEIDHINGQRDDNRLENLRLVTRKENMQNAKQYNTNTSGVTGVSWRKDKNKWRAYAMIDYKQQTLGHYVDWFDAVCARMSANNQYGFHENHGEAVMYKRTYVSERSYKIGEWISRFFISIWILAGVTGIVTTIMEYI